MVVPPERLSLKAGDTLFVRGGAADRAYLIVSGTVAFRDAAGGSVPGVLPRTDIVGEEALEAPGPRLDTAVAATDCELLAITRQHLSERIGEADPLLRFFVGAMLDRQRRTVPAERGSAAEPVSLWAAERETARLALAFEHELRHGLERDEFKVHFQPIVDLATRRLGGFEALMRWEHPVRGLLQPADFVPIAEATGVIAALTRFCLTRVAADLPVFQAALPRGVGGPPLYCSVNVSATDLQQESFAAQAASLLVDAGTRPEDVRIEVTESVLMEDPERRSLTLQRCRDQGFSIAIDDFGTGYSSLSYLTALPVAVIKLDQSFTRAMPSDPATRKIVGGIIRLGHDLGLSVIAEGVEVEDQAAMLLALGCTSGQGYLFGRALDASGTLGLIEAWPPAPSRPLVRAAKRA